MPVGCLTNRIAEISRLDVRLSDALSGLHNQLAMQYCHNVLKVYGIFRHYISLLKSQLPKYHLCSAIQLPSKHGYNCPRT
jgi:hypothetical protein